MAFQHQVSLKSFGNTVLNKRKNAYMQAGKEALKEIRKEMIQQWFFDGGKQLRWQSMWLASSYSSYSYINSSTNEMKIYFSSWFDIGKYTQKQRAEKWKENRMAGKRDWFEDDVEHSWNFIDSAQYVADLQINKGIIGLPEQSSVRRNKFGEPLWVNPNSHVKEPLRSVFARGSDNATWEEKVNKFLK